MINKQSDAVTNIFVSFKSLCVGMAKSRVIIFAAGLLVVWVSKLIYSQGKNKIIKDSGNNNFSVRFKLFSILSLSIIYSLFILFNPWEYTYGNTRMIIPLLSQLFIWVILFYKESFNYPKKLKMFVRTVLILSLLSMMNIKIIPLLAKDNFHIPKNYFQIAKFKDNMNGNRKLNACMIGGNFWESLGNFVAPTLYMSKKIIVTGENYNAGECDLIIAPFNVMIEDEKFLGRMEMELKGQSYKVYTKENIIINDKHLKQ